MIVVFDKDYLRSLYETGMSDDKKTSVSDRHN